MQIRNYNGYYFINPGSLSGCFSPLLNDSNPSFMVLIVEGDVAILYSYTYNLSAKNFEITKIEINKLKLEE
jgi:vacuolar protein sorting-associated protein 29